MEKFALAAKSAMFANCSETGAGVDACCKCRPAFTAHAQICQAHRRAWQSSFFQPQADDKTNNIQVDFAVPVGAAINITQAKAIAANFIVGSLVRRTCALGLEVWHDICTSCSDSV